MKAKELAEILLKNPDVEVLVTYDGEEYSVEEVSLERQGLFKVKVDFDENGYWGSMKDDSMRKAYGKPLQERDVFIIW